MDLKFRDLRHIESLKKVLVLYFFAGLVPLSIYLQPFVPIDELSRDAVAVTEGKFYYGFLSNLGILLWSGSAFICFFTYYLLKVSQTIPNRTFLLFSGCVSSFLLLDDLFQIHEEIAPHYLGINEVFILAMYPLAILSLFFFFPNEIVSSSYLILLSSLTLLALSIAVDVFIDKSMILEDGFKFLGISGWFLYYFDSNKKALLKSLKSPKSTMATSVRNRQAKDLNLVEDIKVTERVSPH